MKLSDILNGISDLKAKGNVDIDISCIECDSRKVTANCLFVAIKGHDVDGHEYIAEAIEKGAKNILILGATGGRLGHFIGNMGLLQYGRKKGVHVILADAQNYICLVENGHIIRKDTQFGKYVSFFAAGETVEGLTLKGFKYPLDHYRLTPDNCGLTVSNEIQKEQAQVFYEKGSLFMIMSRDLK